MGSETPLKEGASRLLISSFFGIFFLPNGNGNGCHIITVKKSVQTGRCCKVLKSVSNSLFSWSSVKGLSIVESINASSLAITCFIFINYINVKGMQFLLWFINQNTVFDIAGILSMRGSSILKRWAESWLVGIAHQQKSVADTAALGGRSLTACPLLHSLNAPPPNPAPRSSISTPSLVH